jgi:hypothetical protein
MEMSAKLFCLKGPYAGQEFPIEEQGVVLGRDPETAGIILDASFVSRSHANIFLSPDGRVVLQDLHSTNGTFLIDPNSGKTRIQGDVVLVDGQRFSLSANDDIVFEIQGFEEADQPAEKDDPGVTRAYFAPPDAPPPAPQAASPSAPPPPPPRPGGVYPGQRDQIGVTMRGTSNVPLILGIVGSVLMIPGVFCSACAGGLIGFSESLSGSGTTWGLFIGLSGLLPVILGSVGAAKGKSQPKISFILLLLASILAGIDWFTSFFMDLLSLAALIVFLVGAIIALTQKKEPAGFA